MESAQRIERTQASLLGGAIGDALGAPIASLGWPEIRDRFGDDGMQMLVPWQGRAGRVSDGTQVMMFVAEGMLRSYVRIQERNIYDPVSVVHHALIRWVTTQGMKPAHRRIDERTGLVGDPRLHVRRSPSETSVAALIEAPAFGWQPHNSVNRCDGLVRAAPIGLFPWGDFLSRHRERAFSVACESARSTHGHPCAYLSAGLFAYLINGLFETEQSLAALVSEALDFMDSGTCLDFYIDRDEERNALPRCQATIRFLLEAVLDFHAQGMAPTPQGIDVLSHNWQSAENVLATAVWCALSAQSFRQGVLWAVNHSNESDRTGLLAGNLLGLRFGLDGLPEAWLAPLELRDWLERLGHDLQWLPQVYLGRGHGEHDAELRERYPEW